MNLEWTQGRKRNKSWEQKSLQESPTEIREIKEFSRSSQDVSCTTDPSKFTLPDFSSPPQTQPVEGSMRTFNFSPFPAGNFNIPEPLPLCSLFWAFPGDGQRNSKCPKTLGAKQDQAAANPDIYFEFLWEPNKYQELSQENSQESTHWVLTDTNSPFFSSDLKWFKAAFFHFKIQWDWGGGSQIHFFFFSSGGNTPKKQLSCQKWSWWHQDETGQGINLSGKTTNINPVLFSTCKQQGYKKLPCIAEGD